MISVIVPVYNVRLFLDNCIESISTQSFKDLEIILVDDGSTDGSGERCDYWATKDERIKVIHKENGGLSDARNHGIKAATGDYISFIDSDDIISATYFEYLYNSLIEHDADISVCQLYKIDEDGNLLSKESTAKDQLIKGQKECMRAFLKDTSIDTTAWRKLYKTPIFKTSGIRYPVGRYHEDVFTTYLIISQCKTIFVGSECLYGYRQRSGSIVNSHFSPKHLDAIYGNIEKLDFISSKYPELRNESSKGIIYAANKCVIRLAKSKTRNSDYLNIIKPIYSKYLPLYLRSSARLYPKIFAICARLNLRILIKAISIFCN